MKKLAKLLIAVAIILTTMPLSSWQALALETTLKTANTNVANVEVVDDKQNETKETETEVVSETPVASEVPTVSATPVASEVPTVSATPVASEAPTVSATPAVAEPTKLITRHIFIKVNEELAEETISEEIIIDDLKVGDEITAAKYAIEKEGYVLVETDKETILLEKENNVITYTYKTQEQVVKTNLVTKHSFTGNDTTIVEEVIVENLVVGAKINATDYAITKEGYKFVLADSETYVLKAENNVITFNYEYQLRERNFETTVQPFASRGRSIDPNKPGEVFSQKTAKWTNENLGQAEIKFQVKGNPMPQGSDVILVVDSSGSTDDNGVWDASVAASKNLINSIYDANSDNRIVYVDFDSSWSGAYTVGKLARANDNVVIKGGGIFGWGEIYNGTAKDLYTNKMWTLDALGIQPDGGTNYSDGLADALEIVNGRSEADKSRPAYVVFLSDGEPNEGNGVREANSLKANSGVKI